MLVNHEQFHQLLVAPTVLAVEIGPALALMEAGRGIHQQPYMSFGYALSHLPPEQIVYLRSLKLR